MRGILGLALMATVVVAASLTTIKARKERRNWAKTTGVCF